jgi:hypothetical protein
MMLAQIAARYRASIRRDECGDPIIPRKKGHLYEDNGQYPPCG